MTMEDPDPGMASSSCCREAVNFLVHRLTQLIEHRPVIRDLLRGLATDELFQVWKMVLEMVYGIQEWTDAKLATSTKAGRRQIREIQTQIREVRGRCGSYDAAGADQQGDDRSQEKTTAGAAVGAGNWEDRLGAVAMNSSVGAARGSLEIASIQFGSLPIFMTKQCVVDWEKNNLGAGSLSSSSKLVFLGVNLLRSKEMRATRPKRFIQIGSMQVGLPN